MNIKKEKRLLEQKREILDNIKKNQMSAAGGFQISDIFLGALAGLLGIGICLWIPVIGWIMIPFIAILFPFLGTHFRQKIAEGELTKLRKKLEYIEDLLV
jgi:hypothetical protein